MKRVFVLPPPFTPIEGENMDVRGPVHAVRGAAVDTIVEASTQMLEAGVQFVDSALRLSH